MIGYDSAFIGGTITLPSFKKEFGLTTKTTAEFNLISANIVSSYQAGCFFGAFFGYPAGYFLGRKRGLCVASLVFLVGSGMMLGANTSRGLTLLYVGRVVAGLGIGAASNLTPIYISEIAPPAIRGRLVGLYEIGWQTGGLVGFWINYGVSETMPANHKQWIVPFAIQLVPAGVFALGLWYLRESPRWLLGKNRREEAIANLGWIRKLGPKERYLVEEINMMDVQLQHERSLVGESFWSPIREVFTIQPIFRRMLLGTSLFIWQNGTGINAINYYSPTIFKSIGITGTNTGLFTTGIFGVIKTACTLIWIFFLIDHAGRRNLMILGAAGGGLCMYYIGAYVKISQPQLHPTATLSSGGISAMAFFYLWTIFYSFSWNGTPWIVNAEMFPGHTRGITQTLAAMSNWFWNFVIVRLTPNMFAKMGYGVYLLFASMMILSIPYLYFLLPETKNVPLEEMDRLFAPGLKPWKANKVVMADVRVAHKVHTSDGTPSIELEEKADGSVEHRERASIDGV
jgi:sugar porter (SP) family MFS transporter